MSSYRVYVVDWVNDDHPIIREHCELPYETPASELLTLAEAKAEIVEHFRDRIADFRAKIAHTRAIRVRDIPYR